MKKTNLVAVCVASALLCGLVLDVVVEGATIASPTDIAGTKLWLDGDDVDGDGVAEGAGESFLPGGTATWVDKSAAGTNNATQSSAVLQPVIVPAGLNSRAIVRFDGGNVSTAGEGDYLSLPNFASGFGQATGFIVFTSNGNAINPVSGRNGGAWNFGTSSANNHFGGGVDDLYDDFGIASRPFVEFSIPTGSPTLYSVLVTGTQFIPFVDGDLGDASAFPLAATPSWSTSPSIGSDSTTRYNGDIAEVIIFDRILTDGTINEFDNEYNDVMFYLQQKWNLGLGLSATIDPPPIPEPSSLLLLSMGLGAFLNRRRKMRG